MTARGMFQLLGGPPELVREPPVPVARDLTRVTLRWLNGYEHYELDEAASRSSGWAVYRWIYRTEAAE
ncbi:DUF5988 family protein [Streptomyces varsoviensis]|uniref:DUF5988 family protein n=1 Tax=Streptomyces varsoviensis TaxID=67373 RepID=UPI0033C7ED70